MTLVTGPLDIYDYLMFLFVVVAIIAFFSLAIFVLALPGKVAMQRRHPHAETVKWMGWAGFLMIIPWVHALIWAFHDSLTIDIRRFPEEEKKAIESEMARLGAIIPDKTDSESDSADTEDDDGNDEVRDPTLSADNQSKQTDDTSRS